MTDTPPPVLTGEHALFLDFDGTLVEIAPTPEGVVVPDGLVPLLARLSTKLGGAVAIVSGRNLDDVTGFLAPLVLPGAGTHGMERRLSDGTLELPDPDVAAEAREMAEAIATKTASLDGVRIERKPYSVGLHYRAAPHFEAQCNRILENAIRGRRNGWEIMRGKLIAEARLAGHSKAGSVGAFMTEEPFAGRVPVFIGDDVTDEAGFEAVAAHGGFGIKVGMGESAARFRLPGPEAVRHYLGALA